MQFITLRIKTSASFDFDSSSVDQPTYIAEVQNRRKILAVSTQLKQLRKESLKIFFSGFLFATALVAY